MTDALADGVVRDYAETRWCTQCRSAYRADFARCPIDGALIAESETDPLLGMTFGHYVIDSFLGEGAMSRVYRAHHSLLTQKQFAVKVMIGDLAATLEMRLRFAQEADAASQLEHPNVVSVVDFGKTDGGLMFIAMELVTGRSLAAVIDAEAPLDAKRALAITRQIALGLGHAHDKGLVHRDLKPDNVIISGSPERVHIVDFGLAIPVDEDRSTRLTNVGLAVGTPSYAAPEQTHDEAIDHRADLFALGVTLFEMLAGKQPFDGGLAEVIRLNASDALPSIASRAKVQVDPAVEAIVRKLTRRDVSARFASAAAVVEAIDDLAAADQSQRIEAMVGERLKTHEQAAVVPPPPAPAPAPGPSRRSRRWLPFAIGGGGVAATAIIALALTGSASAPRVATTPPPIEPVSERPAPAPEPRPAPPPAPPSSTAPTPTEPAASPPTELALSSTASPPPAPEPRKPPSPKLSTGASKPAGSPSTLEREPPVEPARSPEEPLPARPEPPPAKPAEAAPSKPLPPPPMAPADPAPTKPAPPAPKPSTVMTTAQAAIAGLSVRGSLTEADVRRAIERGMPALRACYQQAAQAAMKSPAITVRITLAFDDSRRATASKVLAPGWAALGTCVRGAASGFKVQTAPDVGTVDVIVDIAFKPVSP